MLMGFSNMVIMVLVRRHRYWSSAASLIRFLVSFGLLTFLGLLMSCQIRQSNFPEWDPPDTKFRTDSALLLPVSCFLDPDLAKKHAPYSPGKLSPAQIDRIGQPWKGWKLYEFFFWIVLVVCFIAGHLAHLYRFIYGQKPIIPRTWYRALSPLYWLLTLGSCVATDIICVWHIARLRHWAHTTDWMEKRQGITAEEVIDPTGQVIPIIALGFVLVAVLDKVKFPCCSARPKANGA